MFLLTEVTRLLASKRFLYQLVSPGAHPLTHKQFAINSVFFFQLNAVISACSGKSIEEIIAAGAEKMASVPSGGVGGGSAGGSGGAGAADDGAAEEEEKKSESESDDDMGFSLFG